MEDTALWAIVAAFIGWEALAHWHVLNGAHTLSDRIAWLERAGGWPVRALVACAVVALGVHLEGGF